MVDVFNNKHKIVCRACERCDHSGKTIKNIDSIYYDYSNHNEGDNERDKSGDVRGRKGDSSPVVRKLAGTMLLHRSNVFDKELVQRVIENPKGIVDAMNTLFLPVMADAYRQCCASLNYSSEEKDWYGKFIEEW